MIELAPEVSTEVELRAMTLVDIETVAGWVEKDPEMLPQMAFPEGSTAFTVRNLLANWIGRQDVVVAMAAKGTKDVGMVAATDIQPHPVHSYMVANVHVAIDPDERDGFTARDVISAGHNLAFNKLGLGELVGVIVRSNPLMRRAHMGYKDRNLMVVALTQQEYLEREA